MDFENHEKKIDYMGHDHYHTSKDMKKKDVTKDFIDMREKAKNEFFEMKTHLPTKYHYFTSGEQIGYRECGDIKNPNALHILFIHGNNTCSLTWEKLLNLFHLQKNQKMRLIAACMRGFGYSTYIKESTTVKDYADDLKLFMEEQFQCESYYIVAHSIGGIMALHLALMLKEKCRGMVLINTNPPYGWNGHHNHQIKTKYDLMKKMAQCYLRFNILSKIDNELYQIFLTTLGFKKRSEE